MALIKCSECGKEISDKANKCVHCGYPIDNGIELSNLPLEIVKGIIRAILLGFITYLIVLIMTS